VLLLFLTLSIATDIYVFPQLSKESQEHFEYMIRTQSSFSESAIFCYIGVEMVVSETVNDWRFVGISVGAVLVRREDPCSCCESLSNLCLHKDRCSCCLHKDHQASRAVSTFPLAVLFNMRPRGFARRRCCREWAAAEKVGSLLLLFPSVNPCLHKDPCSCC